MQLNDLQRASQQTAQSDQAREWSSTFKNSDKCTFGRFICFASLMKIQDEHEIHGKTVSFGLELRPIAVICDAQPPVSIKSVSTAWHSNSSQLIYTVRQQTAMPNADRISTGNADKQERQLVLVPVTLINKDIVNFVLQGRLRGEALERKMAEIKQKNRFH